jgi:hydrogenase maturation protease
MPPPSNPVRCLILACGNTLRSDDGAGPWLAAWAEERFAADPTVRVISRQQWTPELAEELALVGSVIFVDCAIDTAPGEVRISPARPSPGNAGLATHHVRAAELLALSKELYGSVPEDALLLTIGAASLEMGEAFSQPVNGALPEACRLLESTIQRLICRE